MSAPAIKIRYLINETNRFFVLLVDSFFLFQFYAAMFAAWLAPPIGIKDPIFRSLK